MVEKACADLELIIEEHQAIVVSEGLTELGSKVQLRQLLANMISNAVNYSRTGIQTKITLSSQLVDAIDPLFKYQKFYEISVRDNGIGMEKAHLSKIFTIFQRLHMRNEYSGNGIGLAICKKIMDNHSGLITVESTPGHGSTFKLYFPVN